jgi:O-antigen/teichoic acid export membrane protein
MSSRKVPTPRQLVEHFRNDSLFRNSFFLVGSTGVMAGLGFGFWWLCARIFTEEQIGLGTALISGMALVMYFSLLGVDSAFIRFLPRSTDRDAELNTGLLLVVATAVALSSGYVLALPWIAPKLDFVRTTPGYAVGFVALASLAAINYLTDSVFIAYRASQYNLLINGIMSLAKLLLPLALVGLGAYGVFASSGAAAFLALVLSVYFMRRRFDYRPQLRVSRHVVRRLFTFASANYLANCLNILPITVLPIVILNRLGKAEAGYFYLAFMVANLLYTVAYAVTHSLFAEGSYLEQELASLVRRAGVILALIMVPSSIVLALIPHWLLALFGHTYSEQASTALSVLALSAPGLAVYSVAQVLLRIREHNFGIISMNVVYSVVIIGLAFLWTERGLAWVAFAWLIGQLAAGGYGLALAGRRRRRPAPARPVAGVAS